jgi:DTW domain-containing protein
MAQASDDAHFKTEESMTRRSAIPDEPRVVCPTCWRPQKVCYCRLIEPLASETRVIILQHPRERRVGINTARIARLALTNSELRLGVDFAHDPVVQHALTAGTSALLYPSSDSIDVRSAPPIQPLTLFVLDGTWSQASKLLRVNPFLQSLPRYGISPAAPSRYQIRREPAEHCLATIEALARLLTEIEPLGDRFQSMLRPFDAMVQQQLAFASANSHLPSRHHHENKPKTRRCVVPELFRTDSNRLVVVIGEANQGSFRDRPFPAEVVHWMAYRLGVSDRFQALIRPDYPLTPSCPQHLKIDGGRVQQGLCFADFLSAWQQFAKPTDVYVGWGRYATDLLARKGLHLKPLVDLRPFVLRYLGPEGGPIDHCAKKLSPYPQAPWAEGRGGERLAALTTLATSMLQKSLTED